MRRIALLVTLFSFIPAVYAQQPAPKIEYSGDGTDLQKVFDDAPPGTIITFDPDAQMEFSSALTIKKSLTLDGINARLLRKIGKTPLMVIESPDVTIRNGEFHGNYKTVSQDDRAPLLWFQAGGFKVERCAFYDGTKDGVMITPLDGEKGKDIVGGAIRDIKAFRMGRDAVSISGGNKGLKVRNVTVENVRLETGYYRGAVEVSDGTDNITVRNVYAADAVYAIDVQDHGDGSAPNTNITIENVEAARCKHILRTENSPRGHANLTLRNLTGAACAAPLLISNTKHVSVENLKILNHTDPKLPPIQLKNCDDIQLTNVTIQTQTFPTAPIKSTNCTNLTAQNLTAKP